MATSSEQGKKTSDIVEYASKETEGNSEDPEVEHEEVIDAFSCPVCLEHFKNPKCLPCQHTFCETCIDTYIQSSQSESKGDDPMKSFSCPVCRQTVESPRPNSQPSEWAALLPSNQVVMSQMGNEAKDQDESEWICGPCKRDNESTVGLYWCPNCSDCLCETCKKFHRRMKTFEMHKIVPIEEMDKMSKGMAKDDEPCPEHQNESLKVYCNGHKKMCCVMCLAVSHRECKEIISIDEMTDLMEENNGSETFINSINDLKTKAGEVYQKKQENLDSLSKQHQDLTSEVENLVELAKSNLDCFKENFKSKFNILHKQQHQKVLETLDKVEDFQKTLVESEKMLKTVASHGTKKQLFITMEKVKMQLVAHMDKLKFVPDQNQEVQYILKTNENLTSVSKDKDFSNVIVKHELDENNILSVVQSVQSVCEISNITQMKAVKLWDAKGKGWLTGGVLLTGDLLVCCDHENDKLIVYDGFGRFLCDKKLQYRPISLATSSENEIFVLGERTTSSIYIYTLNNRSFNLMHTINISATPKGISVFDSKIILTYGNKIDVMTTVGSKIHSFPILENEEEGGFHFLATDGLNAYYGKFRTLKIQSLGGKMLKEYELPKEFHNCYGIALDKNGNIYICCDFSKNICLVSRDCSESRLFLQSNSMPFVIGFNESRTKFFVTMDNDDHNVDNLLLEVYELKDK